MFLKLTYPRNYRSIKERSKFFDDVPHKERLICAICRDILIEPQQSECGCRFCRCCINESIKNCERFCPGCNIRESIKQNLIYDKAVEKEIFELEMTCINKNCKSRFRLKELETHLEVCEYREEKCTECEDIYLYKEKDLHRGRDCRNIEVECEDCGEKMTRRKLEEKHRNVKEDLDSLCDSWRDVCPWKCSEKIQDNIKRHLEECPEVSVECMMKEMGCTKVLLRKDMNEHMDTEGSFHMRLMVKEVSRLRRENEDLKDKSRKSEDKHRSDLDMLGRTLERSVNEVRVLRERLVTCERSYSELQAGAHAFRKTLSLDSKGESLLSSSDFSVSYGKITWKVERIVDKIRDAKRGLNMVIYSEPFYSSQGGYKLCLKAYPNGDGKGRDSHLSLYFVIMKGEYDDELSWPFSHKISLSILSNDPSLKNHSMKMRPDHNPQCYGKPSSKYNLAAGHPQFISHVELISTGEFVSDDHLTIHASLF